MLEDMGDKKDAIILIDAAAAKSIIERDGLGNVRHIHVNVVVAGTGGKKKITTTQIWELRIPQT